MRLVTRVAGIEGIRPFRVRPITITILVREIVGCRMTWPVLYPSAAYLSSHAVTAHRLKDHHGYVFLLRVRKCTSLYRNNHLNQHHACKSRCHQCRCAISTTASDKEISLYSFSASTYMAVGDSFPNEKDLICTSGPTPLGLGLNFGDTTMYTTVSHPLIRVPIP